MTPARQAAAAAAAPAVAPLLALAAACAAMGPSCSLAAAALAALALSLAAAAACSLSARDALGEGASAALAARSAFASASEGIGWSMREAAAATAAAMASAVESVQAAARRIASTPMVARVSVSLGALPHFSMSGRFDARTGAVPSIGVSWYRTGGILTRASVIGVGEDGAEAVVPLTNRRYAAPFAAMIAEEVGGRGATNNYYMGDVNVTGTRDGDFAAELIGVLDRWGRLGRM